MEKNGTGKTLLAKAIAGHVLERGLVLLLGEHACLALAEAHGTAAPAGAALHLAHEEYPHADQQQHREPVDENLQQQRLLFGRLAFDQHAILEQIADERAVVGFRAVGGEGLAALECARDLAAFDGDLVDAAFGDLRVELRVFERTGLRRAVAEIIEHGHQHDRDDQPEQQILCKIVQGCSSLRRRRKLI